MAHRKIDVDALDADQFLDDEEIARQAPRVGDDEDGSSAPTPANITNISLATPRAASEVLNAVNARASNVRAELNR